MPFRFNVRRSLGVGLIGGGGGAGSAWDPAAKASTISLSNANNTAARSGAAAYKSVKGSLSRNAGSFGFEIKVDTAPNGNNYVGIASTLDSPEASSGGDGQNTAYYPGGFYSGPSGQEDTGFTYGTGDVVGVFLNKTDNTVSYYVNGALRFTRSISGATGPFFPTACLYASGSTVTLNTGPLVYPVSGFVAWG